METTQIDIHHTLIDEFNNKLRTKLLIFTEKVNAFRNVKSTK